MVEKVKKVLKRRHFWRTVGFDELSEIYASQLLRSLSASLVGIFVPIYLYKIGYSVTAISMMFLVWFLVRPLWAYVSARIIGRYGPKHAIAISVMLQILYLSLVLTVQAMYWPLWLIGVVGSLSYGLYLMAFEVDFSKIKHSQHGGKELSYLQMFERLGAVLGPVIGGLVATFIDPRFTIGLAILTLCGSLVPIFMSAEPVRQNQVILLKGFPWKRHTRDMSVQAAFTIENIVSITIWPLFLGIFVLQNNTYAALGLLAAIATAVALVAIYSIGKLIDDDEGRMLLNVGAVSNAILHLFRPFVGAPVQALAVSLANEPLTSMYRMPFLKGLYDAADSVPGYRIVYFMILEISSAIACFAFWAVLAFASARFGDEIALKSTFIIGAIASLLITRQKFAALRQ